MQAAIRLSRSAGLARSTARAASAISAAAGARLGSRALSTAPLFAKHLPLTPAASRYSAVHTRHYHDVGIYGYRKADEYEMPDYTPEQLQNRNENAQLLRFVTYYRDLGHRAADLDPLGLRQPADVYQLDPARYGLTDKTKQYNLDGILHINESATSTSPRATATIDEIVSHLRSVYCDRIAYEFTHIPSPSERRWMYDAIESAAPIASAPFSAEKKRRIVELLSRSEVFDHFMAKRFGQVKRYGLEGAESMMVLLDSLFEAANHAGVEQAVLCMPHRGRLNLLTDLLQLSPKALFHKIKGNSEFPAEIQVCGDVLSHIAASPDLDYGADKPIHVSLLHNPSHLEAVNPVALGKARAKQMSLYDQLMQGGGESATDCNLGDRIMCVQLHGDAAFTGQGVVMETLALSNLPHYSAGGSVHVIVNNQIGYTTPATNARSTVYTSDIGKMINAPVLHVNGDDPEAVVRAALAAFRYRHQFRKDIIIDLISFRRWGHNELDEPSFTQPLMYNVIRSRKSVPRLYEERAVQDGVFENAEAVEELRNARFQELDAAFRECESYEPKLDSFGGNWTQMEHPTATIVSPATGVSEDVLRRVARQSVTVPEDIAVHPRLAKFHVQQRLQRVEEGTRIDWATAEAMAFGSLLLDGHGVRISGQDVGRGTFSQRHAMLVCQKTERTCVPLNTIDPANQGFLEVANSNLSEFAVLGFEYGASIETPNNLIIWEAQFGDFFNTAQVIIDTYLASGESKWLRQSGMVMLLPHGYDGAGPEHSSCRIERFLQLCDDKFDAASDVVEPHNINMHFINPTTPGQYFHALRRQMARNFRKPLIVAAPKTLLRHPQALSSLAEMTEDTSFQPVLGDSLLESSPQSVERVVLMSGKLYYDLIKERADRGLNDSVAIVRVEELCPFPAEAIAEQLSAVVTARNGAPIDIVWCQEETQNSGAWTFMQPRLQKLLEERFDGLKVRYIGRHPLAAPVTGISKNYKAQQAKIIADVFA